MKRSVTFVIFVLLLLMAIQPALVVHFCSGRLAAIEMPSLEMASGCCSGMSVDDSQDRHVIRKTCCRTSVIELSTDDYLQQYTDQSVVPFILLFICSNNFITGSVPEPTVSSGRMDLPLCLFTEGSDLLSRFCVYII